MRLSPARVFALSPLFLRIVSAERLIESSALVECQANSSFTSSLFNIAFTPDNHSLALNVVGDSTFRGKVNLEIQAAAYGYTFLRESLDPCSYQQLSSLCPLSTFQIAFDTIYDNISTSVVGKIPSIAYGIPDLDATVTVHMYAIDDATDSLACVRSQLSNGKTVYQAGVGWATAFVAGMGLLTSALVSGLGHSNTASHVALYALSLFNYFQALAFIGLCAVPLPPIVQSWTQDFSWSMGIIKVGFLQRLATWYQLSTGGTPLNILTTLDTKSVQVLRRGAGIAGESLKRRASPNNLPTDDYIVKGIKRVAFRAGMESTNLFLTGVIFFSIFIIFTVVGLTLFKTLCDVAIRANWMKSERFQDLRDNYLATLKGTIFRILLIGYPQMAVLCLWEFTQVDSPAEVALAVFIFFGMTAALAFAAYNVIIIARRSEQMHSTPAYLLYTDAGTLNKWGFLYVQYRATAYYYIIPAFAYIIIKAMFVGLGQGSGTLQAIALVIIEAVMLISASVLRPWMDKPTNGINIAICAINFLNAIFLMIFTGIFNGPGLLVGVVGVIFFVANAVFALVLLIVVLSASTFSIIRKDPETQYRPVMDNRASFIKSQTALTTELDALAFTARGGHDSMAESKLDLGLQDNDHHRDSTRSDTPTTIPTPYRDNPSMLSLPSNRQYGSDGSSSRDSHRGSSNMRAGSPFSNADSRQRPQSEKTISGFRSQNNNSPWQRGAGYDH